MNWTKRMEETSWDRPYSLLITGMPRSGTRWLAFQLRDKGLDVGHERFRPFGLVSSLHTGMGDCDGVQCAGADTRYFHVAHLVRHPLKVISSCCTLTQTCQEYIKANLWGLPASIPDDVPYFDKRRLQFWMMAYVGWNMKIQRTWRGAPVFRLEDLTTDAGAWNGLCHYIGLHPDESAPSASDDTDRANSKLHLYRQPLTWDELADADGAGLSIVVKFTKKLGYEDAAEAKRTQ